MNYEETYIREKIGQKNPFTVPKGYFDQLTSQVMSQLPEKNNHVARRISLRPILMAAASVAAVLVIGLTVFFQQQSSDEQALAAVDSSYIDDAADYAMLDNMEIYACLSDNN
ncbi:MAG: hypothetical protein IJ637_02430 [Prevotella sp.]|nr:hypothetical protein [Prevotella sp.]